MKKALLFLGIAVVCTALLVAVLLWRGQQSKNSNSTNLNINTPVTDLDTTPVVRDTSTAGVDRAAMLAVANLVAERLGSYATTTIDSVVPELENFLLPAGKNSAETLIAAERTKYATIPSTVGVSSRALTTTVVKFTENTSAVVNVLLQREETVTGAAPTSRTQTLGLELIKTNDTWKVTKTTWQ